jgi:phage FluMu protein Com
MNISCPKCKDVEMIWGNDWDNDDEDNEKFLIWSQYSCPKCETILNIYWSEKDGKEKGR